jgi:hypothetical protein
MRRRRIEKTGKVRLYKCTISTVRYDQRAGVSREFEVHLRVARPGPLRSNRRRIAHRGLRYFQRKIFMQSGMWVPPKKVRIKFEREKAASRPERKIAVSARTMRYYNGRWRATPLPSDLIPLRRTKTETRSLPEEFMRTLDIRSQHRDIHEVAMALLRKAKRLAKKKQKSS